jgi:K+/H+ antiporter YhaU regulatory subunit KhtT
MRWPARSLSPFVGQRLLPSRAPLANLLGDRQSTTYVTEIQVTAQSKLAGRTAREVFRNIVVDSRAVVAPPNLSRRHRRLQRATAAAPGPHERNEPLRLLQVLRREQEYQAEALVNLVIETGDLLIVTGTAKEISLFLEVHQAELATLVQDDERTPVTDLEERVVEAVVLAGSNTISRRLSDLKLSRRFQVKVMGLQHHGRQQVTGLRQQRIETGDPAPAARQHGQPAKCCGIVSLDARGRRGRPADPQIQEPHGAGDHGPRWCCWPPSAGCQSWCWPSPAQR